MLDDGTGMLDFDFEEDIVRNPYNIKYWLNYLTFKANASPKHRNLLHERALKMLPGSYKIWIQYLSMSDGCLFARCYATFVTASFASDLRYFTAVEERVVQVQKRSIVDPAREAVNNTFERALVFLNKMPRIWVEYLKFLMQLHKITHTRLTFDRCLRALPITQHEQIWKLYLQFIQQA
eukprot:gene7592-7083_t